MLVYGKENCFSCIYLYSIWLHKLSPVALNYGIVNKRLCFFKYDDLKFKKLTWRIILLSFFSRSCVNGDGLFCAVVTSVYNIYNIYAHTYIHAVSYMYQASCHWNLCILSDLFLKRTPLDHVVFIPIL